MTSQAIASGRMRVLNHVGELFMEMGEYKFEDVTPTDVVEVA